MRDTKPIRSFVDLEVFQLAYQASLELHKVTKDFPADERFGLVDQMRRCSKSICANLAEGFGKQSHSKPEFRRFISMSIGSADEMTVWIMYSKDLGYITQDNFDRYREAYSRIARMLTSLYKHWS
jgi:four helix bundle protein